MVKFNDGDWVRFRGNLGMVTDIKEITVPLPMKNYLLYKVEFDEQPSEWINEMYLVKA